MCPCFPYNIADRSLLMVRFLANTMPDIATSAGTVYASWPLSLAACLLFPDVPLALVAVVEGICIGSSELAKHLCQTCLKLQESADTL